MTTNESEENYNNKIVNKIIKWMQSFPQLFHSVIIAL